MVLNTEIKLYGMVASIIRTPTNLSTYIYYGHVGKISGRSNASPESAHEAGYLLPTDCGAVSGDLLLIDGVYYLLVSIEKYIDNGILACYKGKLYRCNSLVSIYSYDATTKKVGTLVKSGVRCLITQESASVLSDKAVAISDYKGRNTPFHIYCRESDGLTKDTQVVVDQDNRRYRVLDNFNPFVIDGVAQTKVMWENAQ